MKRQLESESNEISTKKNHFSSPLENLYEQVNEINEYYNEYCTSTTIARILISCINSPENCNNSRGMIDDIKSKHKTTSNYEELLYASHQRQEVIDPTVRLKNRLWEISNVLDYMLEMFSQESIVDHNKTNVLKFLNSFVQLMTCQGEIMKCIKKVDLKKLRTYRPLFDDCMNHEAAFLDYLRENNDKNVLSLYFFQQTESLKELNKQFNAFLETDTENDSELLSLSN